MSISVASVSAMPFPATHETASYLRAFVHDRMLALFVFDVVDDVGIYRVAVALLRYTTHHEKIMTIFTTRGFQGFSRSFVSTTV
jgi:hypothetical protein